MKGFALAVLMAFAATYISPSIGFAQGKQGAVLLLPESDMDRELADDLTEVLISALIERSGKEFRIIGKEGFKKVLNEKLADDGTPCLNSIECVRQMGKKQDLALLVFGRVGKAMGGYRLEVWKVSLTSAPDRPQYRKHVPGDIAKLIEEVELVANWVLTPDNPYLTIVVNVEGAQILLDGKPVDYLGRPIAVAPGSRTVEASKEGYESAKGTVNCEHEQSCRVDLTLKKIAVVTKPIEKPVKPKEVTPPPVEEETSLMPWVYVLSGVALASAGGGIWMFTDMLATEDEIAEYQNEKCPDKQCWVTGIEPNDLEDAVNEKLDEGQNSAMWATVFTSTAIVAGTAAATLLVIEMAGGDSADVGGIIAPQVGDGYSGFVFQRSF